MARLPLPDWLALATARQKVLDAFPETDPEEVSAALLHALLDGKVAVRARCRTWYNHASQVQVGRHVWAAGTVAMDWDANRFIIRPDGQAGHIFTDVIARRVGLERWLGPSASGGENIREADAVARARPTPTETSPPPNVPPWLNLWQVAKTLAPRTCSLASWWVSDPPIPLEALARVEARLIGTDPNIGNAIEAIKTKLRPGEDEARAISTVWVTDPHCMAQLSQEMERQKEKRRSLGRFLLQSVIPDRLRSMLLRGGYEVTARAADGQVVTLTPRDLVGLDLNFSTNTMSGDGTVYSAVRVRPRVTLLLASNAGHRAVVEDSPRCSPQPSPAAPPPSLAAPRPEATDDTRQRAIASRGGAPPSYDWKAFNQEALRAANLDGFTTRMEMAAQMRKWVAEHWEEQPDERTIQRRLAELYPSDLPER